MEGERFNIENDLCIICRERPPDPSKPEHILLNALGRRMTTLRALCADCNNKLGATADKDLAESVTPLRNTANLLSGKNRPPHSIKGVKSGGIEYDLLPGGVPELRPKMPLRINEEEGNLSVQATNEEQARRLLLHAAKAIDIPDEHIQLFVEHALSQGTKHSGFAPSAQHNLKFGEGHSQEAMAKACLVLWSELVGNDETWRSTMTSFEVI